MDSEEHPELVKGYFETKHHFNKINQTRCISFAEKDS